MKQGTLGEERYVSLATFRRDGREVRTPVWAAPLGDALCVYTNGRSGKVKRIRHTARVRLAPCDARGKLPGRARWTDGTARLVEDRAGQDRAFAALHAKYGWQMRLLELGARLSGRWRDRAIVEIRLAPA
ncbi:MAG TPA: PPOX class F420-dependent oxidoreductase [Myxococcota bacterium]|nr:PPOX class F420-dependent oxidoreductase [Myxococcota bacterium]